METAKPEDRIGWILVHSRAQYPDDRVTPQDELAKRYKPGKGCKWHWIFPRRIREGGPYTLLFAWQGEIFGEGSGSVTHKVDDDSFDFAFKLTDYRSIPPVALAGLPVPDSYRGLIRLNPEILAAYRKQSGS